MLSDGRRALKPVLDESGRPKVMLPQMIMAKFTQMLTGKAPKNEGFTRRRRKEAAAEPVVVAPAPAKTITKRGAWLGSAWSDAAGVAACLRPAAGGWHVPEGAAGGRAARERRRDPAT